MSLVHFYILHKNGTTNQQKFHSQSPDRTLKFTSRTSQRTLGVNHFITMDMSI
jgi:hypothetical protein